MNVFCMKEHTSDAPGSLGGTELITNCVKPQLIDVESTCLKYKMAQRHLYCSVQRVPAGVESDGVAAVCFMSGNPSDEEHAFVQKKVMWSCI